MNFIAEIRDRHSPVPDFAHIKRRGTMIAEFFANALKRAIAREMTVAELLGGAEHLARSGERTLAAELYRAWVQHNADNPLLYAVYFNLGVVLSDNGDLADA